MGELYERIQAGGFLPLQLTLDPLQKILIDIMDMIKDHEGKIENIQNTKADKSDLQNLQDKVDNNKSETDKRIDDLEKLINDKTAELQKSISDLNEKADNAMSKAEEALGKADDASSKLNEALEKANQALEKVEQLQASGNDHLQSDLEDLSKRLGELENTVKSNDERLTNEIEEIKRKLDEKPDKKDLKCMSKQHDEGEKRLSFEDIMQSLNNLEDRIKNLENRSAEDNASKNTNDNHENCASKSDIANIDKRIDDLANELRNLKRASENVRARKLAPAANPAKDEGSVYPVKPPTERSLPISSVSDADMDELHEAIKRLNERVDGVDKTLEDHEKSINENSEKLNAHENALAENSQKISNHENKLNAHDIKLEDHEKRISGLEGKLNEAGLSDIQELLKKLQADLNSRPDKNLIERLFEKFKESLNNVVDMINKKENGDGKSQFATKDDLSRLESMIKSITVEFDEAAAARKCTKCLSCGMGYRQVTGALPDAQQASILGAAPISQVVDGAKKPCFVYGTDHELYYSDSPRGRSFVVTGRNAPKSAK